MDTLSHISFIGVEPAPGVRARDVDAAIMPRPLVAAEHRARAARRKEAAMDPFMAWTLRRAGLRPDAYRAGAMQRRVSACLRRLRVATPACARALLERQPELLPVVINTALIGVSEFFRDGDVFADLEKKVIPRLLAERRRLRVCSVGVSSGQELYSVAMLLAEAGALDRAELMGVDCRAEAIRRARSGTYRVEDMGGVDIRRRRRFFQSVDGLWRISSVIADRIHWDKQDILELEAGGSCDLMLFRNVTIYLNQEHSAEAWERIDGQLAPGGYVVTGRAERPPASLPLVRVAPSIYQKNVS